MLKTETYFSILLVLVVVDRKGNDEVQMHE